MHVKEIIYIHQVYINKKECIRIKLIEQGCVNESSSSIIGINKLLCECGRRTVHARFLTASSEFLAERVARKGVLVGRVRLSPRQSGQRVSRGARSCGEMKREVEGRE